MDEQLLKDAERWRWLRRQYAEGRYTYFAERCGNTESAIDEEIDELIAADSATSEQK